MVQDNILHKTPVSTGEDNLRHYISSTFCILYRKESFI